MIYSHFFFSIHVDFVSFSVPYLLAVTLCLGVKMTLFQPPARTHAYGFFLSSFVFQLPPTPNPSISMPSTSQVLLSPELPAAQSSTFQRTKKTTSNKPRERMSEWERESFLNTYTPKKSKETISLKQSDTDCPNGPLLLAILPGRFEKKKKEKGKHYCASGHHWWVTRFYLLSLHHPH